MKKQAPKIKPNRERRLRTVSIQLTDEQIARIEKDAKRHDEKMPETVRRIIDRHFFLSDLLRARLVTAADEIRRE